MIQLQIENAQNIIIHSNQEKQEMLERAIELLNDVIQQEDYDTIYNQKEKKVQEGHQPNKQSKTKINQHLKDSNVNKF